MKCSRCAGIMVFETYFSKYERHDGYRCLQCGEIIDPVILMNRSAQKYGLLPSELSDHLNLLVERTTFLKDQNL